MKKLLIIALAPLILCLSPYIHSQDLDLSNFQNLSKDQIEMAKDQISKNNTEPPLIIASSDKASESTEKKEVDEKSDILNKQFGYNFISTSPTSIIATGDLPLPNNYKISIGDVLTVILSGSKEAIFDSKVKLDGTILFPELGSISVAGESFQDIKSKLKNVIDQSYIGVQIDLSLKNLSAKKITIVGAVNNPGTYLVNPFTTISNSLAYSGGIKSFGSLRNIELLRANEDTFNFDLYELLIDGDRSKDITIESGDVILVGPANKFININGEVKRPGSYEIIQDEDLSDLLKFSLGFKGGANVGKITLNKFDTQSSSIIKILTDNTNHSLKDVLSVDIYPIKSENVSSILVRGAIKEPGYYKLEDYQTLEDLINGIEFIEVYPWLGVLEQFDKNNLVKSTTLFNLRDPKTYQSIKILPNSKVFFANLNSREFDVSPMSKDLIADYDLRINHKQGTFYLPIYGRYNIESFIDYLGLDMSDVDIEATYISPLDNIIVKDDYKNMQFVAKKYNTVTFRSPVNDLIQVTIQGAIDYPGTYTMNSSSVIEDLYQLVGDFKSEAFLQGIIFTRESIRDRQSKSIQKSKQDLQKALLTSTQKGEDIGDISIIMALSESIEPENLGRIAGDFSPKSLSAISTILIDGDAITIPRNPNVINVLGEVLNPIAFEYSDALTVSSAINNAGGYQDYADKKNVYVIKANGLIEKASRSIFTKNVKLAAGDTIVVPRKIITSNPSLQAIMPVTKILSDVAFSAAAIKSLSNSNSN